MDRLAVVGLGNIGASIALALREAKLKDTEIVGTDNDGNRLTTASKLNVVDVTTKNIRSAVENSRLVIVTEPVGALRETFRAISPNLPDGAVVTETSAPKVKSLEWAEELLGSGVDFVEGRPLIKRVPDVDAGPDPSMFKDAEYCLIPSRYTSSSALSLVTSMVEAIGSNPIFLDAQEYDSYSSALAHMPIVLSAAFTTAMSSSDGWREMHKVASTEFATLSQLASEDPVDSEEAIRSNPELVVHWIDRLISELYSYREHIAEDNTDLLDSLIRAWESRARWDAGTVVDSEDSGMPSSSISLASTLLGDRLANRYKKLTSNEDKDANTWTYKKKY